MKKIGLFLCECGGNISEAVDFDGLGQSLDGLDIEPVVVRDRLLCSVDGQKLVADTIRERGLEAVVVAACSPKQHEPTFMRALAQGGLNPYLLQMVNIREHCAWVVDDKAAATEKASAQVRAGLRRAALQQAIEQREIECNPDVMVIGAGVAGIEAALRLAEPGDRKVILVEKEPCIGGMVNRYDEVFPDMECAPCLLAPVMDQVIRKDNIELLTLSRVRDVVGYFGNFTVTVEKKARYVNPTACLGCRQCQEACPVRVPSDYHGGMGTRPAIYSPYAGALPNLSALDPELCLRFKGEDCNKCVEACMFGAVDFEQKDEELEYRVGALVVATGFEEHIPEGLLNGEPGKLRNIVSGVQFERLLSATGPTEGRALDADGNEPKRIGIVHCVGGRDPGGVAYCSSVCCRASIKMARAASAKIPGVEVRQFYRDWCLPGLKAEGFMNKLRELGTATPIHYGGPSDIKVIERNGKPWALHRLDGGDEFQEETFDMVVLLGAMKPAADFGPLAELLQVAVGDEGYHVPEQSHLNPVGANIEGVFVIGCAAGPMSAAHSAAQAHAAAGRALGLLVPGKKLALEAIVTVIDDELCSGCKTCISLCPYRAVSFDAEKGVAAVNDALCKGCGTCAAACPSGAALSRHFTDEQIFAEIEEVAR